MNDIKVKTRGKTEKHKRKIYLTSAHATFRNNLTSQIENCNLSPFSPNRPYQKIPGITLNFILIINVFRANEQQRKRKMADRK